MEFKYPEFARTPGKNYRRRLSPFFSCVPVTSSER